MSLQITVLSSGSKGNATLVQSEAVSFLIDCGLSGKETERRLAQAGLSPGELDALVVTHLHADHFSKGAETICLKYGIPIQIHEDNAPHLLAKFPKLDPTHNGPELNRFSFSPFAVGDCVLRPFELPHDMPANTCGLRVETGPPDERLCFAYATDLGRFSQELVPWFKGAGAILLEFNYDTTRLRNSSRPDYLKTRIASPNGHLSNHQAAHALKSILGAGGGMVETVILGHLSEECNRASIAMDEIRKAVPAETLKPITFVVAGQQQVTPPVQVHAAADAYQ